MTNTTIKTITAPGIARLIGCKNLYFAYTRKERDPGFPAPVKAGGNGIGATLWALDDIMAWKKGYKKTTAVTVMGIPSLITRWRSRLSGVSGSAVHGRLRGLNKNSLGINGIEPWKHH